MELRKDLFSFESIFPKIALYSISSRKLVSGGSNSSNNGLLYYNQNTKSYTFVKLPFINGKNSESNYHNEGIETGTIYSILSKDIGGKPIEHLREVLFINRVPYFNGRYYHFILFTNREMESVTRRLLEMNNYYNKKFGNDYFRIDEITNSDDLTELSKFYISDEEKFAAEIAVPYTGPRLLFISRGYNGELEEYSCIFKINEELSLSKIEMLIPNFILDGKSFARIFNDILGDLPPHDYFYGFCNSNHCTLSMVFNGLFKDIVQKILERLEDGIPEVHVSFHEMHNLV